MSTKQKINRDAIKKTEVEAKVELRNNANSFNGRGRRITKQIRIDQRLHKKVKSQANDQAMTMSKYIDSVVIFANKQGYPHKL